jgi:hypothetical protein
VNTGNQAGAAFIRQKLGLEILPIEAILNDSFWGGNTA